jgi:hypothetical protein
MSRTEIAFWAAALGATLGGVASAIGNYLVNLRLLRRQARVDVLHTLHDLNGELKKVAAHPMSFDGVTHLTEVADTLSRHAVIAGRKDYEIAVGVHFRAERMVDLVRQALRGTKSQKAAISELAKLYSAATERANDLDWRTQSYLRGGREVWRYRRLRLRDRFSKESRPTSASGRSPESAEPTE